jgi:hypothetical protein
MGDLASATKPPLRIGTGLAGPGRPKGSRNRASLLLDAIGDAAAEEVLRKVVDRARGGDLKAAEMLLSRIWPPRRSRPVEIDLPAMKAAEDVVAALAAVAAEMAAGRLSPDEAQAVAAVLEIQRKAIETADLEQRIAALERGTAEKR